MTLDVFRDPAAMRDYAEDRRRDGRTIAVVPTMGFLHEGHLSLLREARKRCDVLVMTLFVNPTQFAPGEDLDRYPRDEQGDLDKARSCGADAIYAPPPGAMYLPGAQTRVAVTELSRPLCGARRAGHFEGVATVVTKLFNATRPHVAVFGQKDYQQLALIRRMTRDLDFGIEIVGMPIVREEDGLAMSSRNAYLSADERAQATCLHAGLTAAREARAARTTRCGDLLALARAPIEASALARIDYVELRDADDLSDLADDEHLERPAVLAMAVHVGATRLIDNAVL